MAGDIPTEKPGSPIQTSLNYLDIAGKVAVSAGTGEAVLGGAFGYAAAGTMAGLSHLVTLGNIPPAAAVPEIATDVGVMFATPGILVGVGGLDLYSLKTQLEFDKEHPDIAISVLESTAGGPGL